MVQLIDSFPECVMWDEGAESGFCGGIL